MFGRASLFGFQPAPNGWLRHAEKPSGCGAATDDLDTFREDHARVVMFSRPHLPDSSLYASVWGSLYAYSGFRAIRIRIATAYMRPARIIPERLVERIRTSGLSYTAIARQLGVQQPTITRLAKGEQRSTARIDQLARIVGTTPAYLTGEVDDPTLNAPDEPELSQLETALIEAFRELDDKARAALLYVAQTMTPGATRSTTT